MNFNKYMGLKCLIFKLYYSILYPKNNNLNLDDLELTQIDKLGYDNYISKYLLTLKDSKKLNFIQKFYFYTDNIINYNIIQNFDIKQTKFIFPYSMYISPLVKYINYDFENYLNESFFIILNWNKQFKPIVLDNLKVNYGYEKYSLKFIDKYIKWDNNNKYYKFIKYPNEIETFKLMSSLNTLNTIIHLYLHTFIITEAYNLLQVIVKDSTLYKFLYELIFKSSINGLKFGVDIYVNNIDLLKNEKIMAFSSSEWNNNNIFLKTLNGVDFTKIYDSDKNEHNSESFNHSKKLYLKIYEIINNLLNKIENKEKEEIINKYKSLYNKDINLVDKIVYIIWYTSVIHYRSHVSHKIMKKDVSIYSHSISKTNSKNIENYYPKKKDILYLYNYLINMNIHKSVDSLIIKSYKSNNEYINIWNEQLSKVDIPDNSPWNPNNVTLTISS